MHDHAVIITSFLPVHEGHLFLVEFARKFAGQVTLMMASAESSSIFRAQRRSWVAQLWPQLNALEVDASISGEEVQKWTDAIAELGLEVDCLFAPERFGLRLAEELGVDLMVIEPTVASVELESQAILKSPADHWERLPGPVTASLIRRVCVFGPESTGKTTLCEKLARHFQTVTVPEYSRLYLEKKSENSDYEKCDVLIVARGQQALEHVYSRRARRVLFADTDMLTTKIWSDWLFDETDPWIEEALKDQQYDLYLLCAADVPWVEDEVRYLPDDRQNFERACEQELKRHRRRYLKLEGDWEIRFEKAVRAVEKLLDEPPEPLRASTLSHSCKDLHSSLA